MFIRAQSSSQILYEIPLLLVALFAMCGCNRQSEVVTVATVSEQLTSQFREQYDARPHTTARKLMTAAVDGFDTADGSDKPYLKVAVHYDNGTAHSILPLVQLGDGLFGVTYTDGDAKEQFSAILHFR